MWALRKTTDDEKLLAILEANYQANKNNPKKSSGLAARLEAMQKQAQEMQKLSDLINDIGLFLIKIGEAYRQANEDNESGIRI